MSTYTGPVGVFSGLPPVADEANPSHELGEKMLTSDGRAYRYVKAGAAALVAGTVLQSPVEDTGDESIALVAAAAGATSVTSAAITVTANQYAGGYMITTGEGGTGNGLIYRIKSHPAATAAACTFELEDPLQVAVTAATQVDFVANPYNGVIINPISATGVVVGVAVNDIAATHYGWAQVEGVAPVLADAGGSLTAGIVVTASNQTAGAVEDGDTDTQAIVGVAVTGVAAGEYGAVKLSIG